MEVLKIRNGQADSLFQLDEEGGKQLLETLNLINSIDSSIFVLVDVFFDNANDFLNYSQSIISDIETIGPDFLLYFGKYQRKSSKYLMAVLTSFFSFIEVTPGLLLKDVEAKEIGELFTSQIELYENNSFEFRFLRKFRNYVQHRNLPFRNLNLEYIVSGEKSIKGIIELDRNELIKYGRWKNKNDKYDVGKELLDMECHIILEPIIKKVMLLVVSIMNRLIEAVVDKY